MRSAALAVVACALTASVLSAAPPVGDPPPGFVSEQVASGFDRPCSLRRMPDGRLLIVEQGGRIRVKQPGSDTIDPTPYLVLTDVESGMERGMLDVAIEVHSELHTEIHAYVYYIPISVPKARVSRFTEVNGVLDPNTEVVIWQDPQTWQTCCHKGGGLDFGPDGMLYLTTGDSYVSNDSQSLTSARGKVLRFGPDGTIPGDNPYADGPGGALDEIWARGLRNPWRARWDLPGSLYVIGEVGGNDNQISWEDVNVLTDPEPAVNFGWPDCEGVCSDPTYKDPAFTYPHAGSGAAVIGGFRYRGPQFPGVYQGAYFYADYVRGWIRYLTFDGQNQVVGNVNFDSAAGSQITALEEGADGALYYVRYGAGTLHRIRYEAGNQPPVILEASADVTSGGGPTLSVQFTGAADDPEQDPLLYTWVFGDGGMGNGEMVTHTYLSNGVYDAVLEVFDGFNTTTSETIQITIGHPPVPTIQAPADGALFRAGDTIAFQGTATDPDESLPDSAYTWEVLFHHNEHVHPGPGPYVGTKTGSFFIDTSGHDWHGDTWFEILLHVTDTDGLVSTTSVGVWPEKVDTTFVTSPPGLPVRIDGIPWDTPLVYDTLIGFEHELSVDDQCVDGIQHEFAAWSDAGARTHVLVIPPNDSTVSASFSLTGPCTSFVGDPIAFYDFTEGTGSIVGDSSGVGAPLDLVMEDITKVAWLPNGGIDVFAPTKITSQGPATKLLSAIPATRELSVEAFVLPDPLDQGELARIVALSTDSFLFGGAFVLGHAFDQGQATYEMRLRTTTTDQFGRPSTSMPAGSLKTRVQHVVFVRLPNGVTRFYLDGKLVKVSSASGNMTNWNASDVLSLANENQGNAPWLGQIRTLAIYDRALTQAEIDNNYLAGRNRFRPFAVASADVLAGYAPLSVTLDGTGSSDLVGSILSYDWDFGDGASDTGSIVNHVFDVGEWTVTLTVTDDDGGTDSDTLVVTVVPAPEPEIVVQPQDQTLPEGFRATFSVEATGEEPLQYRWQRDLVDVPGATHATYLTPPLTLADDGASYRCVVTNAYGSDVSDPALLTVFQAPPRVTTGLVTLYTFLEGAGSTVTDVSGVGQPLDLAIQDPQAVSWLQGGGLSFDSPTAVMSGGAAVKVSSALLATSELTFEAWVWPATAGQTGPARIVALSVDSGQTGCDAVLAQTRSAGLSEYQGRIRTTVTNDLGTPAITTAGDYAQVRPTHVALTRAASGARRIYVDGVLAQSDTSKGNFGNWDTNALLALGNEPSLDKPWLGRLYLVAAYDRDLSALEVQQNYFAGPGNTPPNEPPVAAATAQPASGKAPLSVLLSATESYDTDGTLVAYDWTFSDGGTGSGSTVNHVFQAQGVYSVTLVVTDDDGDTATTGLTVDVGPPNELPIAVATSDVTSGKVPLDVQFDGSGSSDPDGVLVDWAWDFGDGSTAAGEQVAHQFVTPGTYDVTLVVTDEDGATDSDTVTVDAGPPNVPPVAGLTTDVTSGGVPLTVVFDGTSSADSDGVIVAWSWSFGDGKSKSGAVVQHTYKAEGPHTAILTVVDDDGAQDSATVDIDVLTAPPTITEEPADRTVLLGLRAAFRVRAEGSEPLGYQWQRDQVNIPGATGRLYLTPPTTLGDDGAHLRCIVTNAYGSSTSAEALLTVSTVPPPWGATGPAGLYSFDEGEGDGTSVPDLSGRATRALDLADKSRVARSKDGLRFVRDEGVTLPVADLDGLFGLGGAATLAAWVHPEGERGDATIAVLAARGVAPLELRLGAETGQRADGRWVHLVVTRDAQGRLSAWVDGSPVAPGVASSVGRRTGLTLGRGLHGALGTLAVFDRALTADEVEALYAAGR